jgi:hypothetical protein
VRAKERQKESFSFLKKRDKKPLLPDPEPLAIKQLPPPFTTNPQWVCCEIEARHYLSFRKIKKPLLDCSLRLERLKESKFFGSFFQKRTAFLSSLLHQDLAPS